MTTAPETGQKLAAALRWQIEAGADEAILDAPVDRFAAQPPNPAPKPARERAPSNAAPAPTTTTAPPNLAPADAARMLRESEGFMKIGKLPKRDDFDANLDRYQQIEAEEARQAELEFREEQLTEEKNVLEAAREAKQTMRAEHKANVPRGRARASVDACRDGRGLREGVLDTLSCILGSVFSDHLRHFRHP